MKLHQLKRSKWLKDKQRRVGRWDATWTGNYSGKWLKWQKARSGFSMKAFFEWGQTSIVQRLPKAKWFTRYFKLVKEVTVINLGKLEQDVRISDDMEISKAVLKELGYIKKAEGIVKILWDWDYSKHIKFVDIDVFSKSAQEKIANPGKWGSKWSRTYKAAKELTAKTPRVKAVKAKKEVKAKVEKTPKAEKIVKEKAPKVEKVVKDKAPKADKPAVKKTVKKVTKKETE